MTPAELDALGRESDWGAVHALVAGFGVSGFAAADSLIQLGARVTVLDEGDSSRLREKATLLELLGATVRLGPGATNTLPADVDVVVTSPGWPAGTPMLLAAAARGLCVWGEVELGWRLRGENPAPWLAVTGSIGRGETVSMLDAILRAAGLNAAAVGNGRVPVLEAIMNPEGFDVLAVELSGAQLQSSSSISATASAIVDLSAARPHWHGSAAAGPPALAKVYERTRVACVYNVQQPATEELVRAADVIEGCRAIGFTLRIPAPGMIGVVDGVIADRAFVEAAASSAAELCSLDDLSSTEPGHVANALAAAALARAHGVSAQAVRTGLRGA